MNRVRSIALLHLGAPHYDVLEGSIKTPHFLEPMNLRGSGTLELTEDGTLRSESSDVPVDPLLGRHLLHYLVEESIGQGGMSVVYRGTDELLHRPVAIKVLHPFLARKSDCRARLAREARAVARLEHENILKIFAYSGDPPTLDQHPVSPSQEGDAVGEKNAAILKKARMAEKESHIGFLVTEFVPGDTLKRFWTSNRLWELPEAGVLCCWVLAKALAHAHEQGVIHRDLKPENIMVRDDGVLKLMDFGIAQVADSKSLTVTGTLLGSPAHMAPENIEGYPSDERSDLFSLGTVLYWLTTRFLPFEALTPHALLKAIVDADFTPPQQRQPRISDDLLKVLNRAMAKKPDDRYQTAEEFAAALEHVLEEAGLCASFADCNRFLQNPAAEVESLQQKVCDAFLRRASLLLDEGHAARALSVLGRVMASYPNDAEVAQLLERLNNLPDENKDCKNQDSELKSEAQKSEAQNFVVGDDSSFNEESGLVHVPLNERSAKGLADEKKRTKTPVALFVATLGIGILLALTAWIAREVEKPTSGDLSSEKELALVDKRPPEVKISVHKGKLRLAQKAVVSAKPVLSVKPVLLPKAKQLLRFRNVKVAQKKSQNGRLGRASEEEHLATDKNTQNLVKKEAKIGSQALRSVELRVQPWANVYVDGKKVASEVKATVLQLMPGEHDVLLENPLAKKWQRKVHIPKEGEGRVPRLRISLSPKPASLIVKANVDADIILVEPKTGRRLFVGQCAQSEKEPIRIELSKGERAYAVVLTKSGYISKTVHRRFATGKTEIVQVVLEAEPNVSSHPTSN